MLNWAILRNPMNWVTVVLMVGIASIALHLILSDYNETPA